MDAGLVPRGKGTNRGGAALHNVLGEPPAPRGRLRFARSQRRDHLGILEGEDLA